MANTLQTLTSLLATLVTNTNRSVSGLEVGDAIYSAFNITPVVAKSANYTATQDDGLINVTTGGGTVTITLPAVASARTGQRYVIRKVDAAVGSITIDGDGSETINGVTTKSVSVQWDALEVINTGSEWLGFSLSGA